MIAHWLFVFVSDDHGQDLVEYAVLSTLVALVTFGAVLALGTAIQNWLTAIADSIQSAEP